MAPEANDLLALLPTFAPAFLAALGVNVNMAATAVLLGLLAGLPLAALRARGGLPGRVAAAVVAPLRAAPTFVVMFFLLNALPASWTWGPWRLAMTPWLAVAGSLGVYATAYVSDNGVPALAQWRAGSRGAALLFLMGLARAFFVMVLSSGFGAAVGVVEATTVTLRALESLPALSDRLLLMALVVACFVLIFQSLYALVDRGRLALTRRFSPPSPGAAGG